jgi:riboflavin synthase
MLNKPKKMTKILIVSGLLMVSQYSFAQQAPQIAFPAMTYSDAQMAAANCDKNVMLRMHAQAKARYEAQYNSVSDLLVRQQIEATPKEAINNRLSCVDNALRQLDGLKNNVMGIYNMITGIGNMDLGALGAKALNQMSNMACSTVNSYVGGKVYSAVSPYNSALTSIPGTITGTVGTVQTPFGGINVGQMANDQIRQNGGTTPTSTTIRDGAQTIINNVPPIFK